MGDSNEFFYIDEDGNKSDAALHAELLTPEADLVGLIQVREERLAAGADPALVDQLWPLPPEFAKGAGQGR